MKTKFFQVVVLAFISLTLIAAAPAPVRKAPAVLNLAEVVRQIHYPTILVEQRVSGNVVVAVTVDDKGFVQESHIVRSDNPLLNATCLESAKMLRFTPAQKGEERVTATVQIPFRFVPQS